jgi:hypothetical protein
MLPSSFEQQSVRYNLLTRRNAGENLSAVAIEHFADMRFDASELIRTGGDKDPVAIVQANDRITRNHCMR